MFKVLQWVSKGSSWLRGASGDFKGVPRGTRELPRVFQLSFIGKSMHFKVFKHISGVR